jgi:hypothetical protein
MFIYIYCYENSIPVNDEKFVIDTFKVVSEDMDEFYDEEGKKSRHRSTNFE